MRLQRRRSRSAFPAAPGFQQRQRFVGRDAIGDVAEVDRAHEFGGLTCPPTSRQTGLPSALGPQIPYRIDDGAGRQMDGAFVRPDPAQLAVAGDMPPETPADLADPIEIKPHHQVAHGFDGGDSRSRCRGRW